MQVIEACDTVSVSRAYTNSNHMAWVLGKKSWPWPWPCYPRLRPRHSWGVLKILEAKARPRKQPDWY